MRILILMLACFCAPFAYADGPAPNGEDKGTWLAAPLRAGSIEQLSNIWTADFFDGQLGQGDRMRHSLDIRDPDQADLAFSGLFGPVALPAAITSIGNAGAKPAMPLRDGKAVDQSRTAPISLTDIVVVLLCAILAAGLMLAAGIRKGSFAPFLGHRADRRSHRPPPSPSAD